MAINWKMRCKNLEKDLKEMDDTAAELRTWVHSADKKVNEQAKQILDLKIVKDKQLSTCIDLQRKLSIEEEATDILKEEILVLKAKVSLIGAMSKAIIEEE